MWCAVLAGLSEGDRSDHAVWAALVYFSPVVPSEERGKGYLVNHALCKGLHRFACATAQVLMSPFKLWRDTKSRSCSHEWPGHPGSLMHCEWYFQNKLRDLSPLITLPSHHQLLQTSACVSTPGGRPDHAVSEQVLSVPFLV